MPRTILDATVWLNFARVDSVAKLIEAMPNGLAVGLLVETVEVRVWPRHSALAGQPFSLDDYVTRGLLERAEMSQEEMAVFHAAKQMYRLGAGETEALVIGVSRGWTVATDDRAARKKLASHNPPIKLSGTIGLLRALVDAKAVARSEAAELLRIMCERGGRLPNEKI